SFSFRSSVRDIVRKAVPCDTAFEEKEPDDGDFEECGREEDMPQYDAVVAVLCTVAEADVFYPWRRKQEPSYGAGLILSGRRVLTTAHSVDQYTQLEVGKEVWGPRYTATMLAVALSVILINVGRNGASGGGPAFDERGKCVGLKLQSQGYRSGDFVPAEVIKHFIQDYDKNGAYTGLPLLSIKWQKMENPYLRMLMKMEHDEQGVLITEVGPNYPESVILKPNDVILASMGLTLIMMEQGRRIEFSYLIGRKYVGDKIVIKVREVLKADINAGYKTEFTLQNQVLVTFNDKPVEGLNSLVSMVETCNEDFMKFTFGNKKLPFSAFFSAMLSSSILFKRLSQLVVAISYRSQSSCEMLRVFVLG
ncbi:hypothetical protein C3L33_07293, partial [Rhododendron williamsianum]